MDRINSFWICNLITFTLLLIVSLFASNFNLLNQLYHYPIDLAVFVVYLILGYLLTRWFLKSAQKYKVFETFISFIYFYTLFVLLVDGNLNSDWPHSSGGLFDKLLIAGVNLLVLSFQGERLLAFVVLAVVHVYMIFRVWSLAK